MSKKLDGKNQLEEMLSKPLPESGKLQQTAGGLKRDRFEAWISSPPFERNISRIPDDPAQYSWPGNYREYDVQLAWEAFEEGAKDPEEKLAALEALVKKSSLIEVPATKAVNRGGHPVVVTDGVMLTHKDYKIQAEQRTKDLHLAASLARKLAKCRDALKQLDNDLMRDAQRKGIIKTTLKETET